MINRNSKSDGKVVINVCLIVLAINQHPKYPVILCANRDELHSRPTKAAHHWQQHPHIFAGQDLEKGGTWLGVTTTGRIAAVTNVRQPQLIEKEDYQSRGEIVKSYLSGVMEQKEFLTGLQSNPSMYQGYNVIVGNSKEFYYYSN